MHLNSDSIIITILCIFIKHTQEQKCSLNAAAQKARITLKEIETLTYTCSSTTDLVLLGQQLEDLKTTFQSKLPRSESIIVRAAVVERATRTKKKYANLMARQRQCSDLAERGRKGRRKMDSRFRNRVGARADRLRKVN